MPKKVVKKNVMKRIQSPKDASIEKVLVQNFVALQKVMTNLSLKFDNLTVQISKLLDLFEISAKTLAQKEFKMGKDSSNLDSKKLIKKMNELMEQNKVLARGLTLIHEKGEEMPIKENIKPPKKIPLIPRGPKPTSIDINSYEKSIASEAPRKFRQLPKE